MFEMVVWKSTHGHMAVKGYTKTDKRPSSSVDPLANLLTRGFPPILATHVGSSLVQPLVSLGTDQ